MIDAQNKTLDVEDRHIDGEDRRQQSFDSIEDNLKNEDLNKELTEEDLLATSILFFIGGYETTASLLSCVLYSLAMNEKCQQKLYEELKTFNGEFDYENIAKMVYLEAIVAETLRLYNPISAFGRIAAEDNPLGLLLMIFFVYCFNIFCNYRRNRNNNTERNYC